MSTDIQSAVRCFDILECLAEAGKPLILGEIVAATGLPASTAHSLISTLQRRGYILHVGPRKGYTLGPGIQALAERMVEPYDLGSIAAPYLERLRDEVDRESVYLGIFRGWKVVPALYLASDSLLAAGRSPVTTALHSSSQGKLLLSQLSRSEFDRWVRYHGLPAVTPHTITDVDALWAELERVRNLGYAVSDEESSQGVFSMAAPVRDAGGAVVAAVAVGCPKMRMDAERSGRYPARLSETALRISKELRSMAGASSRYDRAADRPERRDPSWTP